MRVWDRGFRVEGLRGGVGYIWARTMWGEVNRGGKKNIIWVSGFVFACFGLREGGGLVLEVYRLWYNSTLGSRVIKKKRGQVTFERERYEA